MALLLDAGVRPVIAGRVAEDGTVPRHRPAPSTLVSARERGRTLDDLLSEAWEGVAAAASSTACPVCDGELAPRWSAGAGVVAGRCRDCGSELS
jgi:hypothetical protein